METLFEKITSLDNLEKAYYKTQKGDGKYNKQSLLFSLDLTKNLLELQHELVSETYEVSGYNIFSVYEPKERVIYAPKYRDKIVQLSLFFALSEELDKKFIYDSYACIKGKGTHIAVDRLQYFIKHAKWNYGEDTYILKIDIKKYFYTIKKDILMNIVKKRIQDEKVVRLLHKIIYSTDGDGIPLGNAVSQLLANMYLNELDQYAKHQLGIKYYLRYMDDIVIVCRNKQESDYILTQLSNFIINILGLTPNKNKTKSFPIEQGINSIGYRTYATHILLRRESKIKIKRKVKKIKRLLDSNKIEITKAEQIFNSWLGHASRASSYNLIQHLINKYKYIKINQKGRLEIIC